MKKYLFRFLIYSSVVLMIGFILIPFYNMILLSITPENIYLREDFILYPKEVTWDSFKYVFNNNTIWQGLVITIIVTLVGTIYNLFLTITAAYALNSDFPGKKIYVGLIFIALFLDGGLISNYLLISKIGLIDSIFSMILPTGINIAYLLLLYKAFGNIPSSVIESARLDGANDVQILSKIVIPMSKPIIAAIALYYAVERWNEWYLGMLYINTSSLRPLQLILKGIVSNANSIANSELADNLGIIPFSTGIKMACTVVTMIPVVLIYPLLQKHFIEGISEGSIKE